MILCIDMQNDFSGGTDWDVPGIYEIVAPIRALAEAFPDRIMFTRFLNPGTGHFAAYNLCMPDTPGVEVLPPLLEFVRPGMCFDKFTYSCFSSKELLDYLRGAGVKDLYLTGVETDCCVMGTAFSAMDEGFNVFMVKDCLASSDPAGHDYALHVVERLRPGATVTSADLLGNKELPL